MRRTSRALAIGSMVALALGCAVATSPLLGDCADGTSCGGASSAAAGAIAAAGAGANASTGGVTTAGTTSSTAVSGGQATTGGAGSGGAAAAGGAGAGGTPNGGMAGLAGSGNAGSAGQGGTAGASEPVLGDDVTVAGTPVALITMPSGGGNRDLGVLRDDDRPPVGNNESDRQYDTFTADPNRAEDWLGYRFDAPRSLMRVIFQTGIMFPDGGWFDSLRVQVRNGAVWTDVPGVRTTPNYPGDGGESFATYQFDFAPISGDAIRVFGAPGGSARFISCGELRVFEED